MVLPAVVGVCVGSGGICKVSLRVSAPRRARTLQRVDCTIKPIVKDAGGRLATIPTPAECVPSLHSSLLRLVSPRAQHSESHKWGSKARGR